MEEKETTGLSQKEIILYQLLGVAMIGLSFFLFYKAYQIYKSK
jgi:cell division protein FtsL